MNYEKIYYTLIASRKQMNRIKKDGVFEKHHILPKAFGGSNSIDNLVLLTPREHYIAHLLLVKFNEGIKKAKMTYALLKMCCNNQNQKRKISSRQYDYVKKQVTMNCSGKNNPLFGKDPFSEEQKEKIRNNMLGEKNHRFGKIPHNKGKKGNPLSEEHKKKLSEANKGRKLSEEIKKKMSFATRGLKKSEEHRKKLSEVNKGKKLSEETKKKMSFSRKGQPTIIYVCPYCQKMGKGSAMFRWHFDNCANNK